MSLEEQQKIESAFKKQQEANALNSSERELLITLKDLGINDKETFLAYNRAVRQRNEGNGLSPDVSHSPYNKTEDQPSNDQISRLVEIVKAQQDEIEGLKQHVMFGDVRGKVNSFLKANPDKYHISQTVPAVQEAIAIHFSNILRKGEKYTIEEVVAFHEKQELEKWKAIKQKENEMGDLYPEAFGEVDKIKEKAEKLISKKTEDEKETEGEGEKKLLDTVLSEKDKADLERERQAAKAEIKSDLEIEQNKTTEKPAFKSKISGSQNVSASDVDNIIKKVFPGKSEGQAEDKKE